MEIVRRVTQLMNVLTQVVKLVTKLRPHVVENVHMHPIQNPVLTVLNLQHVANIIQEGNSLMGIRRDSTSELIPE